MEVSSVKSITANRHTRNNSNNNHNNNNNNNSSKNNRYKNSALLSGPQASRTATTTTAAAHDDQSDASIMAKYNLRTKSIQNRIEVERRKNAPRRPKPKQKPAPLSKYRRKTANFRERCRMQEMNDAFKRLQSVVPDIFATSSSTDHHEEDFCRIESTSSSSAATSASAAAAAAAASAAASKVTKIHTLKLAVNYISALTHILNNQASESTSVAASIVSPNDNRLMMANNDENLAVSPAPYQNHPHPHHHYQQQHYHHQSTASNHHQANINNNNNKIKCQKLNQNLSSSSSVMMIDDSRHKDLTNINSCQFISPQASSIGIGYSSRPPNYLFESELAQRSPIASQAKLAAPFKAVITLDECHHQRSSCLNGDVFASAVASIPVVDASISSNRHISGGNSVETNHFSRYHCCDDTKRNTNMIEQATPADIMTTDHAGDTFHLSSAYSLLSNDDDHNDDLHHHDDSNLLDDLGALINDLQDDGDDLPEDEHNFSSLVSGLID